MIITYKKNGVVFSTTKDNDDLLFSCKEKGCNKVVKVKAKTDIELVEAKDIFNFAFDEEDLFFVNGYQSWTETYLKTIKEKENDVYKFPKFLLNIAPIHRYSNRPFYEYDKAKLHSYDIMYCQGNHELFILNNNYRTAYLVIEILKKEKAICLLSDLEYISLKAGEEITIYDYDIHFSYEKGLANYEKKYPLRNIEKIFGYTSWYNYYQNINEDIILRDLKGLDERFNLFQIDDGYETFVGDWRNIDPVKFPHGLKGIVEQIHAKGLKAGIWLAPFFAEKKSEIFQKRPDLFVKDEKGKPIQCGVNWSGPYVLNLEIPEAVQYVKESLQYFVDLGFDFFKLDFIYSVNIGKLPTSRARTSEKAYSLLREVLKDKMILGCGATLFNSYEKFDYLRIGPDMSLLFDDHKWMQHLHRERPSTKVTIKNTISRHIFDQRLFANDPDVFLLRDTNIKLTKAQKESLMTINALFGSVLMNSDDMLEYSSESKELLNKGLDLFKNATDKTFKVVGDCVDITYKLRGEEHGFIYNTLKGEMSNVR